MTFPTGTLGESGLQITRIGLGAWAIGGSGWSYAWGHQDDRDSIATIHAAVAAGVNWIDTAAVYGFGHAEEVVGRALRTMPAADRPYVFTKCGLVWDELDRSRGVRKVMEPANVRRELEASLRRLGIDVIDLYQVHWPGDGERLGRVGAGAPVSTAGGTPLEEYWQLMADLKTEGKVRAIGLSNHDAAQLAAAAAIAPVDAVQPPFSALRRAAAPELEWADRDGAAAIVYSPMASGLLTGSFTLERARSLPADDWRASHPDFTSRLDQNLAVAGVLSDVADRHGVPTSAAAVAWALAWPGVTGAIVGARRPEQVADWSTAAEIELSDTDLDEVARVLQRSGAGEGPVRPAQRVTH